MSSFIVGYPSSGGKVLRRQNYSKELNGLETISETYLVRTADLISLTPARNTTHSSFSSASIKYSRMQVETTSSSEQDGGVCELNVQFVGLTSSSGLPPAVVRIIPATGSGIYGPSVNIEAEFISDLDETAILQGQFTSLTQQNPSTTVGMYRMPFSINGIQMPAVPKQPFKQEGVSINSGFYYRYEGYVANNIQITRRGGLVVVVATFNEFAVGLNGSSGGFSKGIFNSSAGSSRGGSNYTI